MTRALKGRDFTEHRLEGTLHGWSYENHNYKVNLTLCWDGCDIAIKFKQNGYTDDNNHVGRGEPSFRDDNILAALAICNAALLKKNYGVEGL